MPRAEVGTPKWVANKMKSKGLQRLRWYCQMCEKQCRDENGFKCHCMSEAHQRQMQVFSQRAGKYMDEFSKDFEGEFMKLMRTRYCRTKVLANTVYQDVISDKQHVHMNATIWSTLSEFVLYLERTGKVHLEKSERGFVLEYIDKEKLRKERDADAKRKAELTAEQRRERQFNRQVEAAWQEKRKIEGENPPEEERLPFVRDDESKPIEFSLPSQVIPSTDDNKKINFRKLDKTDDSPVIIKHTNKSLSSGDLLRLRQPREWERMSNRMGSASYSSLIVFNVLREQERLPLFRLSTNSKEVSHATNSAHAEVAAHQSCFSSADGKEKQETS
ncbi:uncharacterized protein LOC129617564 [Condylostylus longicornis]|uniref:uncharacterized protein LOC129617564 n=1 Tax=Condylostylus longicornis TaxID=2530218 RepID=UPI00244E21F1|nr:uncharacterized protein LOC129617564 [Condylostylus longicornis]